MLRVGVLVGEASGDLLGEALMRSIREIHPDTVFEGIGGPRMQAEGCRSLYPMERLSLVGIVEVLKHLPELLLLRRRLTHHFRTNPPDVFIGVDAPDFNLSLERSLRDVGIPVVHYVSPTVWAWRSYRVHKLARAADLVLTLFPFEAEFLKANQVPVRFVGHPLFDVIPLESDPEPARRALGLPPDCELVALLPGSRVNEVRNLAEIFLRAAAWLLERRPGLRFAVPLTSSATRAIFEERLRHTAPRLPIAMLDGQSHTVMQASNAVLVASGTATLEAMLLKRPMVVAYRLAPLSYQIIKRLIRVSTVSPPNLLTGRPLVPEFIQDAATPQRLGAAVLEFLQDPERTDEMRRTFAELHRTLRRDSSRCAAEAVFRLIGRPTAAAG